MLKRLNKIKFATGLALLSIALSACNKQPSNITGKWTTTIEKVYHSPNTYGPFSVGGDKTERQLTQQSICFLNNNGTIEFISGDALKPTHPRHGLKFKTANWEVDGDTLNISAPCELFAPGKTNVNYTAKYRIIASGEKNLILQPKSTQIQRIPADKSPSEEIPCGNAIITFTRLQDSN